MEAYAGKLKQLELLLSDKEAAGLNPDSRDQMEATLRGIEELVDDLQYDTELLEGERLVRPPSGSSLTGCTMTNAWRVPQDWRRACRAACRPSAGVSWLTAGSSKTSAPRPAKSNDSSRRTRQRWRRFAV